MQLGNWLLHELSVQMAIPDHNMVNELHGSVEWDNMKWGGTKKLYKLRMVPLRSLLCNSLM